MNQKNQRSGSTYEDVRAKANRLRGYQDTGEMGFALVLVNGTGFSGASKARQWCTPGNVKLGLPYQA